MSGTGSFYMTAARRQLVDWLNGIGGEKVAAPGEYLAVDDLISECGYVGEPKAWTQLLYSAEKIGIIARETRGKRTLAIRLTPAFREGPAPAPAPAVDLDALVGSPAFLDAILARIVERLGPNDALDDARTKLHAATEANQRLRTKDRERSDVLAAVTEERDTLRARVRTLEANVDAMRNGERDVDAERHEHATGRLMESPAKARGRRAG